MHPLSRKEERRSVPSLWFQLASFLCSRICALTGRFGASEAFILCDDLVEGALWPPGKPKITHVCDFVNTRTQRLCTDPRLLPRREGLKSGWRIHNLQSGQVEGKKEKAISSLALDKLAVGIFSLPQIYHVVTKVHSHPPLGKPLEALAACAVATLKKDMERPD